MIVSQLISKVGLDTSDVTTGLQSFSQVMVSGVGTATQQAQLRIDALSERIGFQKRQLDILGQGLTETARQYGENSVQVQRAQLSYDRLANSIQQSEKQLPILNQRLGEINEKARQGSDIAGQFGESFKQGLIGIVGPAAAAAAVLGGVAKVADSFKEAFTFGAQLETNTRSIEVQLHGIRDTGQAFRQAQAYADKYKLTQEETNEAIVASIPVIRNSAASMGDILGVFDRLQLRQPGKTFSDAARALGELQAGQYTSLNKIFNVPLEDAHKLSLEIKAGGDAVQLVGQYLTDNGLSMDALTVKTEGATGALRDYARAQEDLKIAQGKFAEGPGINILGAASAGLGDLTKMLGGGDNGSILKNNAALIQANVAAYVAYSAALLKTGSLEQALAVAARVRGEVYRQATEATIGSAGAFDANRQAALAYAGSAQIATRATKELTDEERTRLEKQRESTGGRAEDAFTRLKTAEADYQRERGDRLSEHQRKLSDITRDGAERLTEIDATYQQQRADADRGYLDKRADIAHDLTRKLADLERDFAGDQARMRSEAATRLQEIDTSLAERLVDLRRASSERIAEIESQASEQAEERRDAAAERARVTAERRAELEQQLSQRLADFDQQQIDRRITAQESYQEKLTSLAERHADQEAQAQRAAADRAQAEQDRLVDMAEAAADRSEDRAQRHADKLADIQRNAESGAQGRITRLTGETFTTDFAGAAGGGSDTARLLAEEEARFRLEEDRAARDEQRARDKLERDRQRQEQAAQERAQAAEQSYQDELAAADAAYAAEAAKADEKAARDRARLEEQGAAQIAALEAQAAKADEQAAQQEAKEDEKRQRQIDKERATLATREADAIADAAKQRERLSADLVADLATRNAAYQQQRADAQTHAGEQLADAEAAYVAQLAKLAEAHANQRTEAEQATADRIASEADSFARQDEQRAAAYSRQLDTLKTALGEQLAEYTRVQLELGDITQKEADRRQGIIEAQYGAQAKAQKDAYDAFFGNTFDQFGSKETPDRLGAGPAPGAGGVMIGSVTVNGVQDAKGFLNELRRIVVGEVRANGGNADAYWGGT